MFIVRSSANPIVLLFLNPPNAVGVPAGTAVTAVGGVTTGYPRAMHGTLSECGASALGLRFRAQRVELRVACRIAELINIAPCIPHLLKTLRGPGALERMCRGKGEIQEPRLQRSCHKHPETQLEPKF